MTTSPYQDASAQQPGAAPYASYGQTPYGQAPYGQAPGWAGQPMPPVPAGAHFPPSGPIGRVRGTGVAILLTIVTLGIYSLVWYYSVHEEMKRHTGNGLGGGLALVIALFLGFVSPFVTSSEVGALYERAGRAKPVSGATGLWYLPGVFILVGPIVWFVKTNGALNAYWRSLGAA
ncbi:DUF4234 domain-containing protein [Geodermatophilus sp. SYSU D00814]